MGPACHEPVTIMPSQLHVVQISFFSDPQQRSPEQLLDAWPTLVEVAEAASRSAVRVSVVQACSHSKQLVHNAVRYCFLPFGEAPSSSENVAGFRELLRNLAPDVLHVHGLGFPRHVLSMLAHAPGVPIILQDHADRPPRIWRRALWRRAMAQAAAITFCTLEHMRPFETAGLLSPQTHFYEIPESTSRFSPGDRENARRVTQIEGDPAVLWVGHLNENKDPLTVLAGLSEAARTLPGLRLWCCFGTAPLMHKVQRRIAADPMLLGRVHLLGRVPHERVEHLMRAADIFVLGSHHESTGFSLIEALACGLPPVVTDIPSFRSLTAAGTVGMLWPCNDANALSEAVRSVAHRLDSGTRAAVRAHFERELSFDSLGSKLAAMYQQVSDRRRGAVSGARRSEERTSALTS
jgi:glycosyltransferase involved in cell wall biosynthesis